MKYQFMPMFWGDFFANTLHLSSQEIGAYVLLIAHAWEHEGYIPYHGAQRIARVNNLHWPRIREVLMPFFEWEKDTVTDTPSRGIHHRVRSQLTMAAEISNKRKGAAIQMHSKRTANVSILHPHLQLQLQSKDTSLGKGSEVPEAKPQRVGMSPDVGDDYRAPPATKSDHVLAPLPDKQPPRPPLQKPVADKKPTETSREELEAIYTARAAERPMKRPNDGTP